MPAVTDFQAITLFLTLSCLTDVHCDLELPRLEACGIPQAALTCFWGGVLLFLPMWAYTFFIFLVSFFVRGSVDRYLSN